MRQPRPIAIIKRQGLTTPPFVANNTLVDDPVALVDDPTALVGGPTTTIPGIKANVAVRRTYTKVKKRR